jgi:hypothetical protein
MEFDFQYIFRSRNRHDLNSLQDLLERALATNKGNKDRPHDITPGIPDHVAAFLDFVGAFDKRCLLARAFIDQKLSKSLRSGGSSSHRRGSIGDSSHHSHHSRRSHPELPGTPTPSSSTRSHTRSRTKAGRTPASDVRAEYLATLSLCHLDPRYLSPDTSPNLVILAAMHVQPKPAALLSMFAMAGYFLVRIHNRYGREYHYSDFLFHRPRIILNQKTNLS